MAAPGLAGWIFGRRRWPGASCRSAGSRFGRARRPCSRARSMAARSLEKTCSDKSGSGSSQEGPRSAERKPRRRASAMPCTPSRRQARRKARQIQLSRRRRMVMPGRSGSARAWRSLVQRPCLGPAAELAGDGVGLAELGRERGPGRGRAAGQGVGGEPEDGVEPRAGVADGAAGGAAVAEGWRVGVLGGLDAGLASCLASRLRRRGRGRGRGRPIRRRRAVPSSVRGSSGGGGRSGSWRCCRPSGETPEHNMNER